MNNGCGDGPGPDYQMVRAGKSTDHQYKQGAIYLLQTGAKSAFSILQSISEYLVEYC